MSAHDLTYALDAAYDRAIHSSPGEDRPGIRRAFGAALRALREGDPRPGVLLLYRWP